MAPKPSIERTSSSGLRCLKAAAHGERQVAWNALRKASMLMVAIDRPAVRITIPTLHILNCH